MGDATATEKLTRRFPEKRAFITGAASGLGHALALEFARAGWRLGILDMSQQGLDLTRSKLQAAGASLVRSYCGSVSSEAFVSASVTDFSARQGGLDIIVNNAGVGVAGAVDATPPEDWRWIVDINLLGAVWGCRAALPIMRRARAGVILNIASAAGFAAAPNMAAYNVTKAGVISLSETLAGEVVDTGIQVSCAMPGFFRSNLLGTLRAPDGRARRRPSPARALAVRCDGGRARDPFRSGRRKALYRVASRVLAVLEAEASIASVVPQSNTESRPRPVRWMSRRKAKRPESAHQTAESFFAGTFHSVSEQHVQRYVHEFAFRWNTRSPLGVKNMERAAEPLRGADMARG